MPKDRRASFDRARVSPYSRSLKDTGCKDGGSLSPLVGDEREWEEARCPICMEHPHNAVLLLCSSQEKGWAVKEPARRFMNSKTRCCSLETCNFGGNYSELRKHARLEHPSDRPSETSAIRQSNWTTLERELDINDALVHQLDFEDAWDGWPNWDELGDADFWSDGTFFDFPMEEMSDFDDDVFGLPLSDSTLFTSLETEVSDSDFSGEYDSLHGRSTAENSSPSSNYQSPSSSSMPTSMYHREHDPTISESSQTSLGQGGNPLLISGSTSSYPIENSSTISAWNPRSNNGGNSFSISSFTARYDRENNSTNSRSRSSYPIENNPTISGSNPRSNNGGNSFLISSSTARYDRENNRTNSRSRSSYERENYVTYSRSRSSYRVENASVNPRRSSSSRTGEDGPLARRAGSRDFSAFSRRRSP
ncbi:uncharacterized protein [Henckelia pumila]|uniref:uncharacterized protein n=1 Tax=Henckelia pumila TaxID=405737 RepID=UPI003C6DF121